MRLPWGAKQAEPGWRRRLEQRERGEQLKRNQGYRVPLNLEEGRRSLVVAST
jgi:hypothetical protein